MGSKGKKILVIGIVLAVVLIVAVVLAVVLSNRETPVEPGPGPDDPIVDNRTASEKIVVNPYKITNPSKNRDVRAQIPRIMNLDDKGFQEYINKKMLQTVTDYQNEIEVMVDDETPAETLYKYVVDYERYNNDVYLSLVVSNDYQTGGMRSNSWKDTYNVDVTAGANKEVFLKDLFQPEADFKAAILAEINRQAEAKGYELVGGNGLSSLPDTQKFYVQDGALVVYFDPAAIAPYVYGELHFKMPFAYSNGRFVI